MRALLLLLIVSSVISCHSDENIKIDLTSKYWNLVVAEKDSNLIDNNNYTLYFEDNVAFFYNERIANFSISNDTLIICDTSYFDKWVIDNGISSKGEVDVKFYDKINGDSLYRVTYKYLIGKILKISKDSLIIEKIEGSGYPFGALKRYCFFNDTALYNKELTIDTIEISTSLCFGKCPAIALKIDKEYKLEYWGGEFADKQGFFCSELPKSDFRILQDIIRVANIEEKRDTFLPPCDAPSVEIIINYNNNKTKRFWGLLGNFPGRLKQFGLHLLNLSKTIAMDSCTAKMNFKVKLDIPKKEVKTSEPQVILELEEVLNIKNVPKKKLRLHNGSK